MDEWSEHGDRPLLRPEERSYLWPAVALVAALVLAGIGVWYLRQGAPETPAQVKAPPSPPPPMAETAPPPKPAIRFPLPGLEPEAAKSLPTLENSDSQLRQWLAELIGEKAFADLFVAEGIVRRIVATVDNLPREKAPRRTFPLDPVKGAFASSGSGETLMVGPANSARYAAHVRVMEALDARALVRIYVRAYPLFQRAYEELGFPGRHFNDRLMEAIDDLLAAPEPKDPPKLLRPKVLYEYADPDLETRSAGQKILIRIGAGNAARVKKKLAEIRRELLAASGGGAAR